jgi:hypothetical protein
VEKRAVDGGYNHPSAPLESRPALSVLQDNLIKIQERERCCSKGRLVEEEANSSSSS